MKGSVRWIALTAIVVAGLVCATVAGIAGAGDIAEIIATATVAAVFILAVVLDD